MKFLTEIVFIYSILVWSYVIGLPNGPPNSNDNELPQQPPQSPPVPDDLWPPSPVIIRPPAPDSSRIGPPSPPETQPGGPWPPGYFDESELVFPDPLDEVLGEIKQEGDHPVSDPRGPIAYKNKVLGG